MQRLKCLFLTLLILFGTLAYPQNPDPTITTTKITQNLYQFLVYVDTHISINVFAFICDDGILMIDSGFDKSIQLIKEELRKISDKKVKYIINTHYNFDHTLSNTEFGSDVTIIGHENCRNELAKLKTFPAAGLPTLTFQDSMKVYFTGEVIDLRFLPGHTNNDIIVHFKNADLLFTGDLIFSNSFPNVQQLGSIDLLEKGLSFMAEKFKGNTRILPSHGDEIKTSDLQPYLNMVKQTRAIVSTAIKNDKTPDDAKSENILKDWKNWNSKLFPTGITTSTWIDNLYSSLEEGKARSGINILKKELQQSGVKAMILKFRNQISSGKSKLLFFEAEMNAWGYALLGENKQNEATEIFKINTELFPESANVWDSLGEAYMLAGNKELAIKNYKKSLELNPNNSNAVDQLKKLNK